MGFLFISVVEPNGTDCLNITGGSDGYYYIQPDPTKQPFQVYCDMTNGGFTLVWNFYPTHTPRKYLTVCLSTNISVCMPLSSHLSVSLSTHLSVPLSTHLSVSLSSLLFVHSFICVSIHTFYTFYSPRCLSVCVSIDNEMNRPIIESIDKRFFSDCSDLSWSVRGGSSEPWQGPTSRYVRQDCNKDYFLWLQRPLVECMG